MPESLCQMADLIDRATKAEALAAKYCQAFHEAIRCPMGVVPAGYEDLYEQKYYTEGGER